MHKIIIKLGSSFNWLNASQFFGALNDNVFKLIVIAYAITMRGPVFAGKVTAIAGAIFVAPFLLFSALAGRLADRFSKRNIIVISKFAGIITMSIACTTFFFKGEYTLYVVLFLIAAESAFFSPSKYGIIPELVKSEDLSMANSLIEAFTYLAIVAGTFLAPIILLLTQKIYFLACSVCLVIAVASFLAGLKIEKTKPAGYKSKGSVFFLVDYIRTLMIFRRRKDLLLAVFAASYFLMLGSFIQLNLIGYCMERLSFDETQGGYMFLPGSIGIGLGAYLAGRLSGRNIELGLVPLGSIGMTVSAFGLGLFKTHIVSAMMLVFLTGTSAGLFIVPIYALIQLRSPSKRRGQVIAASNFFGWLGVLTSAGIIFLLSDILNLSASTGFVVMSVLALALTIVTLFVLGTFLARFLAAVIARLSYRIRIVGVDNIPIEEGALLVSNHCSWSDPLVINALQQRRIRFIMDREFFNKPLLKTFYKFLKVIPISPTDPPKEIVHSLQQARAALDEGFLVCIFAEGAMTRTGFMHSFKTGMEFILKAGNYRIIPIYIGGTWGSTFSFYHGKPLSRLPKRIRRPVGVYIGSPMAADSKAWQVRQKVAELSSDYFKDLKEGRLSLAEHFIKTARKNWKKPCISDSSGANQTYRKVLLTSLALARHFKDRMKRQQRIAILLPHSVEAVYANIAVTMMGASAVNLDLAQSEREIESHINKCGIKTIITTKNCFDKTGLKSSSATLLFLDDFIMQTEGMSNPLLYLKARLAPSSILAGRNKGDNEATVIFSHQSDSEPEAVSLSHRNIYCNIEATRQVLRFVDSDKINAVYPFSNPMGFTYSLWLPIISGIPVCFTDSSLSQAESSGLPRAKSGFGQAQFSGFLSLNVPDVESGGVFQIGTKPQTLGHPIPGVAVRIIDIETQQPLPPGQKGILLVKGPIVFAGYLDNQRTSQISNDSWFNTGKIASLDEDGFLTI